LRIEDSQSCGAEGEGSAICLLVSLPHVRKRSDECDQDCAKAQTRNEHEANFTLGEAEEEYLASWTIKFVKRLLVARG
jgi:hypothetical protein